MARGDVVPAAHALASSAPPMWWCCWECRCAGWLAGVRDWGVAAGERGAAGRCLLGGGLPDGALGRLRCGRGDDRLRRRRWLVGDFFIAVHRLLLRPPAATAPHHGDQLGGADYKKATGAKQEPTL
jgi:hypothetical protein